MAGRARPRDGKFTTVMQWDSYATREFDGRRFGMKSESFMNYLDLAAQSRTGLRVGRRRSRGAETTRGATGGAFGTRTSSCPDLRAFNGSWQSKAEFTVAKQGYVSTRSGWFSDRSAAYLASGRPVITENTGCGDWSGRRRRVPDVR